MTIYCPCKYCRSRLGPLICEGSLTRWTLWSILTLISLYFSLGGFNGKFTIRSKTKSSPHRPCFFTALVASLGFSKLTIGCEKIKTDPQPIFLTGCVHHGLQLVFSPVRRLGHLESKTFKQVDQNHTQDDTMSTLQPLLWSASSSGWSRMIKNIYLATIGNQFQLDGTCLVGLTVPPAAEVKFHSDFKEKAPQVVHHHHHRQNCWQTIGIEIISGKLKSWIGHFRHHHKYQQKKCHQIFTKKSPHISPKKSSTKYSQKSATNITQQKCYQIFTKKHDKYHQKVASNIDLRPQVMT